MCRVGMISSRVSSTVSSRLSGKRGNLDGRDWAWGLAYTDRSDMSKNIIRHLVNILVAVVEESASIPSQVMDCIIDQFENHAVGHCDTSLTFADRLVAVET